MPTLYEYMGIEISFWSNEHYPIHIHAEYNGAEMKVSFFLEEGNIYRTTFKAGKGNFPPAKLKNLKKFVAVYKTEIINAWTEHFVWQKHITPKKITKRL